MQKGLLRQNRHIAKRFMRQMLTPSTLGPWASTFDNTEVALSNNNGADGDNLLNTLFDDLCVGVNGPIISGVAPCTGCFAPDAALAAFNNQNANGQWRLKLVDTVAADTGTLNAWTLGSLRSIAQLQRQYPDGFHIAANASSGMTNGANVSGYVE